MVKINTHFFLSVKWLETLSLGRTVCFADQVTQLSDVPSIPSTPDYVPVHDCPHCCKSGPAGEFDLAIQKATLFKSVVYTFHHSGIKTKIGGPYRTWTDNQGIMSSLL